MAEEDMVSFHYSYCVTGAWWVSEQWILTRRRGGAEKDAEKMRESQNLRTQRQRRCLPPREVSWESEGAILRREKHLLASGEVFLEGSDESMERFAVGRLPADQDEEAVGVEEDRVGGWGPTLREVQRDGRGG
jgi:hypothetical protein